MSTHRVDVAILGSGLAGTLLARQLRRTLPSLDVAVFEKEPTASFKVGESTVELASNYLIRRLGLSTYLYEHQLPKNGLRFFFDTPERDAPLERMSEIGTSSLPYHPAFQINRARLEMDLRRLNVEDGIALHSGGTVSNVELGTAGAPHRFVFTDDTERRQWQCRWLIDAAGRSNLIGRALDLRVPEEHPIAAVWGRFTGLLDLDALGTNEFRSRIRFSSRLLSTVHFCYPGYWIWLIPLRDGVISVGVVGERHILDRSVRSANGFRAFLDRHGAVREILARAAMIDHGSFAHLAYGTRRYFSTDRWGLTGEAGSFADPFYSPGSDYIALENDFITDLIGRDVTEAPSEDFTTRVDLYERFMTFRHEAVMRLYRGLYQILGSYEALRLKWDFDISMYYNLWVDPYMRDRHLDPDYLRLQLRESPHVLQALANFGELFRKVELELKARGDFYRANLGRYTEPLSAIDFVHDVGTSRSREEVLQQVARTFNSIRDRALDLLNDTTTPRATRPLASFMTKRAFA
jgi:flavin-dependent dehydrogenase